MTELSAREKFVAWAESELPACQRLLSKLIAGDVQNGAANAQIAALKIVLEATRVLDAKSPGDIAAAASASGGLAHPGIAAARDELLRRRREAGNEPPVSAGPRQSARRVA